MAGHGNTVLNLTGQRFGRWVVGAEWRYRTCPTKRVVEWSCRCDCGTARWVTAGNLRAHYTTSCGCSRRPTVVVDVGEAAVDELEAGLLDIGPEPPDPAPVTVRCGDCLARHESDLLVPRPCPACGHVAHGRAFARSA